MFGGKCTQQIIHAPTAALDWLAVEDLDAHRALYAVYLAVSVALLLLDEINPLSRMQRGIDQLGSRVGFVVAGLVHVRKLIQIAPKAGLDNCSASNQAYAARART